MLANLSGYLRLHSLKKKKPMSVTDMAVKIFQMGLFIINIACLTGVGS